MSASDKEELQETALGELQAQQSLLLDKIDELRTIGVGGLVELPQLIVCGAQSSGKSSVLEAISRVRFPTKSNVCTRFATEVSLRRLPTPRFKVSIESGPSEKTAEEKAKLGSFSSPEFDNIDQLPDLIESAQKCMTGLDRFGFSEDILKVEICGPDQPELTLVDLPGLYSASSETQSVEGIGIVEGITQRYMQNTRSIILMVISANDDFHNQSVRNNATRCDPSHERTVGIVTQPDRMYQDSETEASWLEIIRGEKSQLKLGWFALVNRSFKTKDVSDDERDRIEKEFFNTGNWSSVPRDRVGISSLRQSLSRILLKHIRSNLPGLISDIEEKIRSRRSQLEKLGPSRSTIHEQRGFLFRLSDQFVRLTRDGVNGQYDDPFFGGLNASDDRWETRLRAIVRVYNEYFAEAMYARGFAEIIVDDSADESSYQALGRDKNLYAPSPPELVIFKRRSELETEITQMVPQYLGRELPGNANQLLVGALFRKQSKPWEAIAHKHLIQVWSSVSSFVGELLRTFTDDHTYGLLQAIVIGPELENMKTRILAKLDELTAHNKNGYPLPLGNAFLDNMQKVKSDRHFLNLQETLGSGPQNITPERLRYATDRLVASSSRFCASEIIDQMQAYYDTTITTFINNVAILAIENCLLEPLPLILTSKTIHDMPDSQVKTLAAEPPSCQEERARLGRELEKLQAGLQVLGQFNIAKGPKPSLNPAESVHERQTSQYPTPTPSPFAGAQRLSSPGNVAANLTPPTSKSNIFAPQPTSSTSSGLFSNPSFGENSFGTTPSQSSFGSSENLFQPQRPTSFMNISEPDSPGPGPPKRGKTGSGLFGGSSSTREPYYYSTTDENTGFEHIYMHICGSPAYIDLSPEEVRVDYYVEDEDEEL
ncbi:hypothetical protein N7468_005640 [Penicillium chermesinum]|uniref:Dynamin family protein n=1 Tax=Penicillium chermesinum TaxID=63820 RepID=A0A9W9NZE7_9EURO|nr:uncharacterized protein N7468_005640 [Penicillium chermesinum]KAJ5232684.1 hypothetical protein N7468_005640 [Penicillium chermesinum]